MTRDESIELATFLGVNLSAGYIVSFGRVGRQTECCVEVAYTEPSAADRLILGQVAVERGLALSWHDRHGEQVATFRSIPARISFNDLTQTELDTCFEIAFGRERLDEAKLYGGVRTMETHDVSEEGASSTQLRAELDGYTLALFVWYGVGIEVRAEFESGGDTPHSANLFGLQKHLQSINVDFGF